MVDLFDDPSLYDAQYHTLTKDIRFYQKLAKQTGGPVLELAVGTGRIASAILKEEIPLVGLDVSLAMLGAARKKLRPFREHCRLIKGSYSKFQLKQKFPLIFCAFNGLQHAYRSEELVQAFRCIRQHLRPKGVFAFDLFNPRLDWLQDRESTPILRERFFDENLNQACDLWETYEYDRATQIKRCYWEYRWADGRSQKRMLNVRVYFPQELMVLIEKAGLKVVKHFGDVDGSPFSSVSPKQIFVCRRL
jgi:SAM-dependent methyltransferase